jgi:hypothetical protein
MQSCHKYNYNLCVNHVVECVVVGCGKQHLYSRICHSWTEYQNGVLVTSVKQEGTCALYIINGW